MSFRTGPSPRQESASLADWRRRTLTAAGFDEDLARRLAAGSVDLHALLELVDRGCPPRLATRILAPLDREGA